MNGETRRPRTRGPRGGRGVRVRGGPPPVVEVEEVAVVGDADQGRPSTRGSRGGRGRLGRGGRSNAPQRPGPFTSDTLAICDISEMPEGRGLETALHSKRARMSQPSYPAPSPSIAPSSSPAPPSPASSLMPSPLVFVECDGSPSPVLPPPTPRRPRQSLRDKGKEFLNYGSDPGTDESDDENTIATVIPRAMQSAMETPLDEEDEEDGDGDWRIAEDPAPAEPVSVPPTATDQPRSWYDFDWRAFPNPEIPPESRRETFSQSNVGPTTPFGDPYDIFVDIWDRPIMEHIASETNKYAQQVAAKMLANNSLLPKSRIGRWFDTTVDELYCYFGLILAMGVVVKSQLNEYWSATPDIFYTPGFSAHMSIDRFLILSKCLHFNDNNVMCGLDLDASEARLYKIQPILSHLNKKFQTMYTPAQNIALDESLLMWKGWLEIGHHIPNKAAKKRIKTYEICESQTGYLWRFEIHAHKKYLSPPHEDPLEARTPSTVLRMTQGLEHKGYTLWMDNFYNSPCLARRLKSLGFDCVGTLRTDRKFVPQALHDLTKRNMRKGEVAGLTAGDVDVMVWRDNNRVAMISTYHGSGQQTVRGTTKPVVILDYNIMMGGVDKKDQLLAMYPVERKRTRVWYQKLFRRLLNVSVLNSFIIHHHTSSIPHRNFRMTLIKTLLSKHCPPPVIPAIAQNRRIDVTHRIDEYDIDQNVNYVRRPRRLCVVCKPRRLHHVLCRLHESIMYEKLFR